jgi:hypothetical protein
MNAAAALLLAATAVNAIPQVDKQQVLASFEADKARTAHHLISPPSMNARCCQRLSR